MATSRSSFFFESLCCVSEGMFGRGEQSRGGGVGVEDTGRRSRSLMLILAEDSLRFGDCFSAWFDFELAVLFCEDILRKGYFNGSATSATISMLFLASRVSGSSY